MAEQGKVNGIESTLEWRYGGFLIQIPPARFGDVLVIHDVDLFDDAGNHYFGYFATLDMLQERLDYYRGSGEGAEGRYFNATGVMVLRDMSAETMRAVVQDLIDSGEVEESFMLAEKLDDPDDSDS
ncbi:MAG: hypothetical protein OEW30_08865 [Acidimicrobiia bacterium]|nr:hypothetical protein [Acidimicrobiia bacterium]MDH5295459.1 hypothetical protein [Acidimicrobiia bacterium]